MVLPFDLRVRAATPRPLAAALALALTTHIAAFGAGAPEFDLRSGSRGHAATHSAGEAPAATLGITRVVRNCDDHGADSLRDAFLAANDNDTIDLGQLACSRITLTTGALTQPAVTPPADVTLAGPQTGQLTIDGSAIDKVLVHRGSGLLTIRNLNITNGANAGQAGGGCIHSEGSVLLAGSAVSSCRQTSTGDSVARGGAIYAKGNVSLQLSSVSGSTADSPGSHSAGGGIYAQNVRLNSSIVSGNTVSAAYSYALGGGVGAAGDVYAAYSTISGNSASEGGGTFSTTLTLLNATISGNDAFAIGGAYARGAVGLYNTTIARNTATLFTGGLYLGSAIVFESSILALNTADSAASDIGSPGALTIYGANNLIMAPGPGIIVPGDTNPANPKLGPLRDNGGPTPTLALLADSPAIDHGNNSLFSFSDQRGIDRVLGTSADIGAYEFVDEVFRNAFDPELE